MTIYDRKCNATRYLALKQWERKQKRKSIEAHLWLVTGLAFYTLIAIQIVREVL
jgi:hypothetical protein